MITMQGKQTKYNTEQAIVNDYLTRLKYNIAKSRILQATKLTHVWICSPDILDIGL